MVESSLNLTFLLMYYMGFSYNEAYNLPLSRRKWFIDRVNKEFADSQANGQNPNSKAAHDNTPEARQLQGLSRDNVPARLRRFS